MFVFQREDYEDKGGQQQDEASKQQTRTPTTLQYREENVYRCVRRLAARAGVVAVSRPALEQIKAAGDAYLKRIVRDAIEFAEHQSLFDNGGGNSMGYPPFI